MATDLPKRDESRDIWLYAGNVDDLSKEPERKKAYNVFVFTVANQRNPVDGRETVRYVPASDLDAIQRKLELSEAHVKALTIREELEVLRLEADDKMRMLRNDLAASESARRLATEQLEAALERVGELELAAGHAMECHERWCNCDIEELSNAMSKLDHVLAQTENTDV